MGTIVAKVLRSGSCIEQCQSNQIIVFIDPGRTYNRTAIKVGSMACQQYCQFNKTPDAFKGNPLNHVVCKYIIGRDKKTDNIIWRES